MADLYVTIKIPGEFLIRVNNAFNGLAGEDIDIVKHGSTINFNIQPKTIGETGPQFGKRFIKQGMWQFVRLYELWQSTLTRWNEIDALSPPSENVPEGVFE